MNKKLLIFLFLGILLIGGFALALNINTFTDSLTSSNITFTKNENITRNLSIYRYADVTSAFMNFSSNNVSSIINLIQIGSFSNSTSMDQVTGVFVSDDYAYVASQGSNSLTIIDISDKSSPTQIGYLSNPSSMRDAVSVDVVGDYAYVTAHTNYSLTIIDISDKSSPTQISVLINATSLNGVWSVDVVGDYAYITGEDGDSLTIINISDKSSPTQIGYLSNPSSMNGAMSVDIVDDYAYVASQYSDSLTIINLSDKSSPTQISTLSNASSMNGAHSVEVVGDYAYVASQGSNSLTIIDISDKSSPTQLGTLSNSTFMNTVWDVEVVGNYAYVTSEGYHSLTIINISDKTSPTQIKTLSNASSMNAAHSVYVVGNYAYVTGTESTSLTIVQVFQTITNPFLEIGTPDGIYEWSLRGAELQGTNAILDELNDTNTILNLIFTGNENQTVYLRIPQHANVISAFMNFSGYESENLSSCTYDNVFISTQNSDADDLFFKSDGTKLYETGYGNNKILQYSCSDAWNLSSCSYDSVFINSQNLWSGGIFFKPDGTKLYEVGFSLTDKIYQYSCSDAWNLSSCTYDAVSISTQDTEPKGLFFKSDGTKLYEVGEGGDKMYQYTCSSAWSLSSCTYDSVFISTQDITPEDLFFKSDGTKLYEIGLDGDKMYQYSCSDAWNLSSCTYDSKSLSTQDTEPKGLFFKSDGTKLYEIGANGDKMYQYTCSSAWSLPSYITNPYLEIGTPDGTYEWNVTGEFSTINKTNNLANAINSNLSECSIDSENYCNVPLLIHSDTAGILQIDNILVNITNISKTLDFASVINTALSSSCSGGVLSGTNCLIPFLFSSTTAGILNYFDININYDPNPFTQLVSPENNSNSPAIKTFNCNATTELDKTVLTNISLYIWNSTNSNVNITTNQITGTSNSTSFNITFDYSDTYLWNCLSYNNETKFDWANNMSLIVDIDNPSVNLEYPTQNQWLNYKNNIYFNYTPEHSTQTVETCKLYGNWSGWHENQTDSSITETLVNSFVVNLTEGHYIWNVWCNTSETGNSAFHITNHTLHIDTISPNLTINYPTGTLNSFTVDINITTTDTNRDYCYFNITRGEVVEVSNTEIVNCQNTTSTLTVEATHVINVFVNDSANNIVTSNSSFTIDTSVPSAGGGGAPAPAPTLDLFCGDTTCSAERGEDFFTCPKDCAVAFTFENINAETLLFNCLEKGKQDNCIWITNPGLFLIFGLVAFLLFFSILFEYKPKAIGFKKWVYRPKKKSLKRRRR